MIIVGFIQHQEHGVISVKNTKRKETFFVGSDFDQPQELFFDKKEAMESGHFYLDSFDDNGDKVDSYKFDEDTGKYTQDF